MIRYKENQISYSVFCKTVINPCKISKSSEQIAKKAYEGWFYPFQEGKLAVDKSEDGHGFSITTLDNVATMLCYGDVLTMVDTPASSIRKMVMNRAVIIDTNNYLHEYTMSMLYVGKQYPLRDPNVLAVIIKNSTPKTLFNLYTLDQMVHYGQTMRNMGMGKTADLWDKIRIELEKAVNAKGYLLDRFAYIPQNFDHLIGQHYANSLAECKPVVRIERKKDRGEEISR